MGGQEVEEAEGDFENPLAGEGGQASPRLRSATFELEGVDGQEEEESNPMFSGQLSKKEQKARAKEQKQEQRKTKQDKRKQMKDKKQTRRKSDVFGESMGSEIEDEEDFQNPLAGLPLAHEQEDNADDLADLADLVIGNDEEQHEVDATTNSSSLDGKALKKQQKAAAKQAKTDASPLLPRDIGAN